MIFKLVRRLIIGRRVQPQQKIMMRQRFAPAEYDLSSLKQQAENNKQQHIPLSVTLRDKNEKVGVVYDSLAITPVCESSNAQVISGNVIQLPEPMDPETERLVQHFMLQEKKQPFIKEQNKLLKFYLEEVKNIRDDLQGSRQYTDNVIASSSENRATVLSEIKEALLQHRLVLKQLGQHFQSDKTRLQSKREVYKPMLSLINHHHPMRRRHLESEFTAFVDKQILLLDKMTQCYDKLIVASSSFLSRIDVQLELIQAVLVPKREQNVDDLLESSVLRPATAGVPFDSDWNLIELRNFITQEN